MQDADTTSKQGDAFIHQEFPEADALAEPTEPTEPTKPTEPLVAKPPTDDTDAFTVTIENIHTEDRNSMPAKAGMAKIRFGMACILLSMRCDRSEWVSTSSLHV